MTLPLAILALLFALTATTLAGWSLARFFSASLAREERIAWSFAAGLLLHVSIYGILLAVRATPEPKKFAAAEAIVLAVSLAVKRPLSGRSGRSGLDPPRISLGIRVLLVLALGAFGLSTLDFLAAPMGAPDFLAIWGWKAKTIFFSEGIPSRLFHDPFAFWSHPEYPLFLPLCLASFAAVLGRFDGQALAVLYPAFEGATLLALFGYLRRRVSPAAGAIGALLAAFCFPLYSAANAGTAEVPMAFAFVLVVAAVFDVIESGSSSAQLRMLVAAMLSATIKQEGSLFLLLLALCLLGRGVVRGHRLSAASSLYLLLPLIVQAGSLRLLRGPALRRDFDFTLLEPGHLGQWLGRWREVLAHLVGVEVSAAAVPLAGLLLFFLFSRRRPEDALLPVLGAQVLAYAVAASLSAFGSAWALETAFARTSIALLPALALVVGARAGVLLERP
jgi:hypothetical protein